MSLSGFYVRLPRPLARRLLRPLAYLNLMRALELRLLKPWVAGMKDGRVLDVGCGHGLYSLDIARRGASLVGCDLEPSAVASARRSTQALGLDGAAFFFIADGARLPLCSERFDLVVCNCVLEHTIDDEATLAAMARALRPGGILYLAVDSAEHELALGFLECLPAAARARLLQPKVSATPTVLAGLDAHLDEVYSVRRRYRREDLAARLTAHGCTVLDSRFYLTGMGAAHYEAFHAFRGLDPAKGIGRLLYMFSSLLLYPLAAWSDSRQTTQGRGIAITARKHMDSAG